MKREREEKKIHHKSCLPIHVNHMVYAELKHLQLQTSHQAYTTYLIHGYIHTLMRARTYKHVHAHHLAHVHKHAHIDTHTDALHFYTHHNLLNLNFWHCEDQFIKSKEVEA